MPLDDCEDLVLVLSDEGSNVAAVPPAVVFAPPVELFHIVHPFLDLTVCKLAHDSLPCVRM